MTLGTRSDWQTLRRHGGGYLLNWGPHLVDQPVQLHGGRVRTVWGDMKQLINPGDAEDQFTAVLTMDDGALVISEFGVGAAVLPTWVVQGTRGTIVVRDMALEVHRATVKAAAGAGAAGEYRGEAGVGRRPRGPARHPLHHHGQPVRRRHGHLSRTSPGRCAARSPTR